MHVYKVASAHVLPWIQPVSRPRPKTAFRKAVSWSCGTSAPVSACSLVQVSLEGLAGLLKAAMVVRDAKQ